MCLTLQGLAGLGASACSPQLGATVLVSHGLDLASCQLAPFSLRALSIGHLSRILSTCEINLILTLSDMAYQSSLASQRTFLLREASSSSSAP